MKDFAINEKRRRFVGQLNARTMETLIGTIGNQYGGLSVKKEGGKYFWGIENYNGTQWEEIPKKMYDRLISFEKQRVREQKQNRA